MFSKSAANDTLQGKAIQAINRKWGDDFRQWQGRENLGIPVCKKKYAPFTLTPDPTNQKKETKYKNYKVQRMYGCHCHSHLRKRVIEKHGERPGWEPFGQWSLVKAKKMSKLLLRRIRDSRTSTTTTLEPPPLPPLRLEEEETPTVEGEEVPMTATSSSTSTATSSCSSSLSELALSTQWNHFCLNGSCAWKIKGKCDDIATELSKESTATTKHQRKT